MTEQHALSGCFGKEVLVASGGMLVALLRLWRLWFVVRGSLWAAVKAKSSSRGIKQGEEVQCDYAE